MTIAEALLAWYEENKRELPWRKDKDPYKIWVSEIMLQQTRVEAVKPYFEKWIERFPTIQSLASASEEEVLYYWQGLGYYSRARNLLAGAREVAANYDARMPETRDEAEKIKGIGAYTAGAILSIAYDKKETAVDGNVLRVFSRLFCLDGDIMKQAVKKEIVKLVEAQLPPGGTGDFNQALMDLGSRICIPREPRCKECPLTTLCAACREGRQRELPMRSKGRPPLAVKLAAGMLAVQEEYLLRKRPDKGILAGLWEFPSIEVAAGESATGRLTAMLKEELGQQIKVSKPFLQTTHIFSHRVWDITFYECALTSAGEIPQGAQAVWCDWRKWQEINFAGPNRKAAEYLVNKIKGAC